MHSPAPQACLWFARLKIIKRYGKAGQNVVFRESYQKRKIILHGEGLSHFLVSSHWSDFLHNSFCEQSNEDDILPFSFYYPSIFFEPGI
jgi:hypothetical protein